MKFCPKCGRQIPEGSDACYYCQTKLPQTQQPVNATQQPVNANQQGGYVPPVAAPATEPEKKKKNKLAIILLIAGVLVAAITVGVLMLTHVICVSHEFEDATCTEAKTCVYCGKAEGEANGHKWEDATCLTPKTCTVCEETEGDIGDHAKGDWEIDTVATLVAEGKEVQKCTVCEETLEEQIIEKKVPAVDGKEFNFTDEEFIEYLDSMWFINRITEYTPEEEDDDTTYYTLTDSSYKTSLLALFHTDENSANNISMITVSSEDEANAAVCAMYIASELCDDFDIDKAVDVCAKGGTYRTDTLEIFVHEFEDSETKTAVVSPR